MDLGNDLGLSTKSTNYFVVLMPSQDFCECIKTVCSRTCSFCTEMLFST